MQITWGAESRERLQLGALGSLVGPPGNKFSQALLCLATICLSRWHIPVAPAFAQRQPIYIEIFFGLGLGLCPRDSQLQLPVFLFRLPDSWLPHCAKVVELFQCTHMQLGLVGHCSIFRWREEALLLQRFLGGTGGGPTHPSVSVTAGVCPPS